MESVVLARTETEMIRLARTHLSALAKREAGKRVKATYSVRTGKPFHEIAAEAEESGSYLIVLASHGYTGAQRVLMGSTAERVVRHAHCPVLTVPTRNRPKSSGHGDAFRVKKILVPLDFSDLSQDALPWAVSLAIEHDAELILLHVVEKYPIDYLVGEELAKHSIAPLKKRARSSLDRLAEIWGREGTIPVSVAVREGNPYEEICQLAKMVCADLIVQTTHGYTGLSHVWLGSTAERVVRHATCPVLTVRATKPEKR
jgi:nucleotide-binding universal stress UspA family protein